MISQEQQKKQVRQQPKQLQIISIPPSKILQNGIKNIQLAYDNTFIICCQPKGFNNAYSIKHLSSGGDELASISIPGFIQFKMFDQYTVIYIKKQKNSKKVTLCSWDILDYTQVEIDHKVSIEYQYLIFKLFAFRESSLIALIQEICFSNIYKVSYYKFPLQVNSKIINQQYSNLDVSKSKQISKQIIQMNNVSMIGFVPTNFDSVDEFISLQFYQLNQDYEGKLSQYKLKHNLNQDKLCWLKARILDVWEPTPKHFYIQFQTYIDEEEFYREALWRELPWGIDNALKLEGYFNFHWTSQTNNLIQIKFHIKDPHRLVFIEYLREIDDLRKPILIPKNRFNIRRLQDGRYLDTVELIQIPVYFISWQDFSVKGKIQGNPDRMLSSILWTNKMIKAIIPQNKGLENQVQIIKIPLWMQLKIVVVHFLEGILKNGSQNLLEQVVKLIES